MPRRAASLSARRLGWLAASLLAAWPAPLLAATAAESRACDPPHTRIVLVGLSDATDHAWQVWTGYAPGALVTHLLADSLRGSRGREVLVIADPQPSAGRAMDDGPAIDAARELEAEIVVTGSIDEFLQEDRREAGKFWRWGVGAPDARSRARVGVTLRVLDANDGSVIIETRVARERTSRATASVDRAAPAPAPPTLDHDGVLGKALGEALTDLVRTIGLRLETRWQARVESISGNVCTLDTGPTRGHFVGQRLEVWRAGVETYDEDLVRLAEEAKVGALVVTAIEAPGRVQTRLVQGDAGPGDAVRACSTGSAPALSLRR